MIDTNLFDPEYKKLLVARFGKELFNRFNSPEYRTYYNMIAKRYGTKFANCCDDTCITMVRQMDDTSWFQSGKS